MGSSYRRLEVQLPQFYHKVQRDAEDACVEVLRMEQQVAEKQLVYEQKEATAAAMLQKMREAGPSDDAATVPGLAVFLEQYWSNSIPRDPDRVQAISKLRDELEGLEPAALLARAESEGVESTDGASDGNPCSRLSLINSIIRLHDGLSEEETAHFAEQILASPEATPGVTPGRGSYHADLWASVEMRAKYRRVLTLFASGASTDEVAALFAKEFKLNMGALGFSEATDSQLPSGSSHDDYNTIVAGSGAPEPACTTSSDFVRGFRDVVVAGENPIVCTEFQVAARSRPTSKFGRRMIIEVAHELGLDYEVTGIGSGKNTHVGRHVVVGRYKTLHSIGKRVLVLQEGGVDCVAELDLRPAAVAGENNVGDNDESKPEQQPEPEPELDIQVLGQGASMRVLEGPYVNPSCTRGRVRTKRGWCHLYDEKKQAVVELQNLPYDNQDDSQMLLPTCRTSSSVAHVPPTDVTRIAPLLDGHQVIQANSAPAMQPVLTYQHFRGWVVPDEKNKFRLKVRQDIGRTVVQTAKSELLKLKDALDERSAKLLQEQVRTNDLDGPLLEEALRYRGRWNSAIDAGAPLATDHGVNKEAAAQHALYSQRLAQVEKIYQEGLKDDLGNKFIQDLIESVKLKSVDSKVKNNGDKKEQKQGNTKTVGFTLEPVQNTSMNTGEIDRMCPVLITTTTKETTQREEVKTCAVKTCDELEAVIVAKLLLEESIWQVNSATGSTLKESQLVSDHSAASVASYDSTTSGINETQDLVRTQSKTLLQAARAQPLLRLQSLGTGKEKLAVKHAWNDARFAESLLDEAADQLSNKRAEVHKKEREATKLAADYDVKLKQVLSVLSNKNMSRMSTDKDLRSDRGKEQVVQIEAVGVTILWVNCTIGRVDQLLRDLERECVEGNGLGWLGSRYGVVTVLDVCVAKPTPEALKEQRSCVFYPTDRLPIEEIYANINGGAELTADFMWGLACAGIIAAVGLFTNSSVMLVASMLISPMMGPILAMTFAMAIKTRTSKEVRRKELRATRDLKDLTNLSEIYRPPLTKGDLVQLPEKQRDNGELKRRLGKLVKLKDPGEEGDDGQAAEPASKKLEELVKAHKQGSLSQEIFHNKVSEATSELPPTEPLRQKLEKLQIEFHTRQTWHALTLDKQDTLWQQHTNMLVKQITEWSTDHDVGQFTTWMVKTMVPEREWNAEWKDSWAAPDDKAVLLPFLESELTEPEAVLLRELAPGTLVPYLGHCATIRRVVQQKTAAKGIVAQSQAEAETLYEVEWDPGQTLDVDKYHESLQQKPGSDGALRQLEIVPSSVARSKTTKLAKWELMKKGARSEAVAVVVAWLMGFGIAPLFMSITRSDKFTGNWWGGTHSLGWAPPITDEMVGRGDFHNFLVGIVFALASGIVVGNGASSGGTNALVGVAISASLLPPVVNSGMCVSFALLGPLWEDDIDWRWDEAHQESTGGGLFATSGLEGLGGLPMRDQLLVAGAISFALYLMNVLIILFVCWTVFVIKAVEFRNTFDLARDDQNSRDQMYKNLPEVVVRPTELPSSFNAANTHSNKQDRTALRSQDALGVTQGRAVGPLKREKTIGDFGEYLFGEEDDVCSPAGGTTPPPAASPALPRFTPERIRKNGNDGENVAEEGNQKLTQNDGQCVIS